jgi:hypothetical protein
MASGGGIDDGEAQVRRGNRRRWRLLWTPWLDSFDRESKEEVAELPSSSVEAGAARNGEGRRRPWQRARLLGGGRGRETEPERGEKGRKGKTASLGGLQRILLGLQSDQEVAHGITWELHAAAPCDSTKKTNTHL